MTQPTGAVVEWVTYDVYGLPTIRTSDGTTVTQSAVGNPYLYTGREYDPESGLYFYRARTYDPGTGRFLQRDPAGYVDDLSLQQYASSSPTCLVDPLGLDPMPSDVVTKEDVENAANRAADSDGNTYRKPDVFKSPPTFHLPSVAPPVAPLPGVALGTPRPPLYPGPQPLAPVGAGAARTVLWPRRRRAPASECPGRAPYSEFAHFRNPVRPAVSKQRRWLDS